MRDGAGGEVAQSEFGAVWTQHASMNISDKPALYAEIRRVLRPALADPGYDGAGIGVLIPVRQPPGGQEPGIDTRTRNAIQCSLRCLGERGFALLTGRWRTHQHITASPGKTGNIARAALVLTHIGHGHIT